MVPIAIYVKILSYMNPKILLNKYDQDQTLFSDPKAQPYWQLYLRETTDYFDQKRVISTFSNWGEIWVRYKNDLCLYCHDKSARREVFYNIPICYSCQRSKENSHIFSQITKTLAKQMYLLKDEDLDKLDCIEKKNPHYRNSSAMTLYLESDVKEYANKKYNGKLQEAIDKKMKKSQLIRDNKNNRQNTRRAELKAALENEGLELRADSKLCQGYIENKLEKDEWTIQEIVSMCGEMRWLFNHTDYKKQLKENVDVNAAEIAKYEGWHNAHKEAYEDVEPWVRKQVLKAYPKPAIYPWKEALLLSKSVETKSNKKHLTIKFKEKVKN
jgi:hypothetical protein